MSENVISECTICSCTVLYGMYAYVHVPHSKSGLIPRSSLSGAGHLGFRGTGEGGTMGEGKGQIGSVYEQPGTEEDDSCHSWRVPSKWKGGQWGAKGARGARGKRNCAMYICECNIYVKND